MARDQRMRGPHRLRNGDRLIIGQYIMGVSLDGEAGAAVGSKPAQSGGFVSSSMPTIPNCGAAIATCRPPIDPQQLKMATGDGATGQSGFSRLGRGVPEAEAGLIPAPGRSRANRQISAQDDMSWATGRSPAPQLPNRARRSPSPRRPGLEPMRSRRRSCAAPSPSPAAAPRRRSLDAAGCCKRRPSNDAAEFARHGGHEQPACRRTFSRTRRRRARRTIR